LTVIFGQVGNERNVCLLFRGEFHNDHYDAYLPVAAKGVQYFRLFLKTAFD
jgi:hypothetical protein